MYTVLVTGANQGIGLECVRQYAHEGHLVYATYLPSGKVQELQDLKAAYPHLIHLLPMDITDEKHISDTATKFKNIPIDILLNNAGTGEKDTLATVTPESLLNTFQVNAVGPFLVTKYFFAHVALSSLKTIATISSIMGSITQNLQDNNPTCYAYKASKTALNMIMSNIALEGIAQGIKVLLLHPGHVSTQLGNQFQGNPITPQESVEKLRYIIATKPASTTQFFYSYEGDLLPW